MIFRCFPPRAVFDFDLANLLRTSSWLSYLDWSGLVYLIFFLISGLFSAYSWELNRFTEFLGESNFLSMAWSLADLRSSDFFWLSLALWMLSLFFIERLNYLSWEACYWELTYLGGYLLCSGMSSFFSSFVNSSWTLSFSVFSGLTVVTFETFREWRARNLFECFLLDLFIALGLTSLGSIVTS